jgi:hypothetical protein
MFLGKLKKKLKQKTLASVTASPNMTPFNN